MLNEINLCIDSVKR